jgi:hypothetical protein
MREVRAKYIAEFQKLLQELQSDGKHISPEVRLEVNEESDHELYRLYVMDFLERKPDGTVGAIELGCAPIETAHPGLRIDAPICWNGVTFKCLAASFPEDDVLAWGNRWIHDESPPLGQQDGLTGVIHSVSEPKTVGENVEFSVDFGSAPFEAFDELLASLGGSILSIGTYLVDREA